MVVRGHITGVTDTALWTAYARGERTIYGHRLPDGLHKNDVLPHPIVTPTTKGSAGSHDVPITCAEVAAQGLVEPTLWDRVQTAALAVFERGVERGRAAGLILADTKYEFGVAESGELLLIDEVHTPDSSRWWVAGQLRGSASRPATNPRASTRRSCAAHSPTSTSAATARFRRCPTTSGRRPRHATLMPTNASPVRRSSTPTTPLHHGFVMRWPIWSDMTRSIPVQAVPAELTADDAAHDECGVLGLSTPHGDGVAQLAFFGLFALQHRGQEAAGIAVSDGKRARVHKEPGLVSTVFSPEALKPLTGYHAIGHTRYSTTGSNAERNIQPFLVETMHGPLSVAHNGNLVNATALRDELLSRGFGLTATSDTEVFTLMLAAAGGQTWQERIERTLPAWKGAFSLVILAADQVIAVRDPWGFRPLSVGRLPHGGHAVASETCALSTLGCLDIDEVKPGEMVTLRGAEIERQQVLAPQPNGARCTFEFVYFSRPDSVWDGKSVHHVRQQLGVELARESMVDADVVIPVPDSSIPAAIGFSNETGLPFNDGLIKNRYIGRTFIEPTQDIRERGVALKFNALSENLEGKRVIMIDDSLVRGTTAGPLVKLVRDAGATEVHMRITCPPITHACHFGVDMGHDDDLMAAQLTVAEMEAHIGADSLAFLSLDGMMRAVAGRDGGDDDGYCNACFTGDYPIAVGDAQAKLAFEGVLH